MNLKLIYCPGNVLENEFVHAVGTLTIIAESSSAEGINPFAPDLKIDQPKAYK